MDILLPEIQGLRFELVAKAKEWDQALQLVILPTLLCGKLLDHYVSLSDDDKKYAETLKMALMRHITSTVQRQWENTMLVRLKINVGMI